MVNQRAYNLNKSYYHSRGAVLIYVLVLSTVVAMLASVAMESGILQIKMSNNFALALNIRKQVETEISSIEHKLATEWVSSLPQHVKFLQFVPDTLLFGDKQGTNYYQIEAEKSNEDGASYHILSTYAVRSKPDLEDYNRAIIRLSTGQWVILILEVDHELKQTQIKILDVNNGNQLFSFKIKARLNSNIVAVDSKQQGFSDVAYMSDEEGTLWKLHLDENWNVTRHSLLGIGEIKGNLVVGKHPQGIGVLVYLFNKDGLLAIEDVKNVLKIFFRCKLLYYSEHFVLWQGYLIANDERNKINIYDAFTGDLIEQSMLSELKEFEEDMINIEAPRIVINKPIYNNPVFVVNSKHRPCYGQFSIIKNRLGRRTWISKLNSKHVQYDFG